MPLSPLSALCVLGVVALLLPATGNGPVAHASPRAATSSAAAPSTSPGPTRAVGYRPPVTGPVRVVRPFQAPSGPYGPGHRGVDLAADAGAVVLATGPGVVTFAGSVAGRGVVVLAHADGVHTEYEPVQPVVHAGQLVAAGQRIAVVDGQHAGCAGVCLHWGARRGATYFDPLRLLVPLGVVHLAPLP